MNTPTTELGAIQQTIRTLRADGWTLSHVFDGVERIGVDNEHEATDVIMNLDESYLHVERSGDTGHVYFVLGNNPDETLADYSVNLECLDVLTESWY